MIRRYRAMIDDPSRLAAFQDAISAAVSPGDIVVDLGCAMGNFSVFACRAGARRVYAVESTPIIEVAREVVRANGFADLVRFLPGLSTEIDVPERAHVVIFEDYPAPLLAPGSIRTVRDAVGRWLAPRGKLLPSRARIWMAPVEDAATYRELDRFAWTGDRVFDVDLSPTRHRVFSQPLPARLSGGALLAAPTLIRDLDLRLASPDLRATLSVRALRPGVIHGLLIWFELRLGQRWLGTGPLSPPVAWEQTFFPLEKPIVVAANSEVDLGLDAGPFGDDMVWQWRVTAGRQVSVSNSLEGMSLNAQELLRWPGGQIPQPGPEIELDRYILEAVDGRRTLDEIATAVIQKFETRFSRPDEARRRVALVTKRARLADPRMPVHGQPHASR